MSKKFLSVFLAVMMAAASAGACVTAFAEEQPAAAAPAAATAETAAPAPDAAQAAQPQPDPALSVRDSAAAPAVQATAEQALPEDVPLELDNAASGSCGANLNWQYANGTLTISGSGPMNDFPREDVPGDPQCMPWYAYREAITTLNIQEGVTSIGNCAFWGCKGLTAVTTPASLQSMGFAAFADCTALREVALPAGRIGESAFIRCSALNKVTVGSGVTAFGISAFEDCTALNAVYIGDVGAWCSIYFGSYQANPLEFARNLYVNGSQVTDLVIPAGVTGVADYAFYNCTQLTSVSVPAGVRFIGDYAFYHCANLARAALPDGLAAIKTSSFESCTALQDTGIPATVSFVGNHAFAWTKIPSAAVRQGVIGGGAFVGCNSLTNVFIGGGVTRIGAGAFENCGRLGAVTYGGSASQWQYLAIGAGNDPLTGAGITYEGSDAGSAPVTPSGVYKGATVKVGRYEQDDNTADGAEALEWTVLDVQGDRALVISKYVLGFARYYRTLISPISWANSQLRGELNGSFLNTAFTESEKAGIASVDLSNEGNSVYGVAGGANTTDRIFVLSASEAGKYFATDDDRIASATAYALSQYALQYPGAPRPANTTLNASFWWLRTPGMFSYSAMYTHYTGSPRDDGMAGANTIVGYRPAMWVNVNAVEVEAPQDNTRGGKLNGFVTRLYQVCLNRAPDAAGLADWINRLSSGKTTGATTAYGFIFSKEFQNRNYCNEHYVKQLYLAFMGRPYDQSGLDYWIGKLESGATREEVFNGFAMSKEFGSLCAGYGITLGEPIALPQYGTVPKGACPVDGRQDGVTAFVTRLYRVCLDRTPEAAGLNDWTGQLWNHARSGREVAFGFVFSKEFQGKNLSDAAYVEYLYKAFFDRASDAAGKADWLNRMHTQGYTREAVFNGFVGSTEFDRLCKKYGIVRG